MELSESLSHNMNPLPNKKEWTKGGHFFSDFGIPRALSGHLKSTPPRKSGLLEIERSLAVHDCSVCTAVRVVGLGADSRCMRLPLGTQTQVPSAKVGGADDRFCVPAHEGVGPAHLGARAGPSTRSVRTGSCLCFVQAKRNSSDLRRSRSPVLTPKSFSSPVHPSRNPLRKEG
jgi:hypothetical protein